MNNFCSIGLKVLAAAGIGVAVCFGLDKIGNIKKPKPNNPQPPQQPQSNEENNYYNPGQQQNNQVCYIEEAKPVTNVEKVVDGLKTAQDICGRGFSLCQNLVMVIDNISKIFRRDNGSGNNYSGCGFGGGGLGMGNQNQTPGNGYQDKYKDPPGFRRISPFILEYVGVGNEGGGGINNYTTNNNYYNQSPQGGYPGMGGW